MPLFIISIKFLVFNISAYAFTIHPFILTKLKNIQHPCFLFKGPYILLAGNSKMYHFSALNFLFLKAHVALLVLEFTAANTDLSLPVVAFYGIVYQLYPFLLILKCICHGHALTIHPFNYKIT